MDLYGKISIIFREIDSFDFTSFFFALDFINFLAHCVAHCDIGQKFHIILMANPRFCVKLQDYQPMTKDYGRHIAENIAKGGVFSKRFVILAVWPNVSS